MDPEERASLAGRSVMMFGLIAVLTYLIAWDEGSPIFAGDSLYPTLGLWGLALASGSGLLVWGRRTLAQGEVHRGRPAEIVTWGQAVLIGSSAFMGSTVAAFVYVLSAFGS